MEYQKVINSLDNMSNQLFKSRTKNWIEITDQSRGVYNTNSDIYVIINLVYVIIVMHTYLLKEQ